MKRNGAAHGLQLMLLAAPEAQESIRGVGEFFENGVPHAQMALDIQVLRNARTVAAAVLRAVRILPGGKRVAVEVLAVHGDAALAHDFQDALQRPFHRFFPAHIDKVAVQHPVGVHGHAVRPQGACVRHALRLKPQQRLDAVLRRKVGDGFHLGGEAAVVHHPCARVRPAPVGVR